MKKTAVWMARLSILAAALSSARLVQGATPALPAPDANGVVTLANQDYVITEADDLIGITRFQTTGGLLVFDISQGAFNVDAMIKGTQFVGRQQLPDVARPPCRRRRASSP